MFSKKTKFVGAIGEMLERLVEQAKNEGFYDEQFLSHYNRLASFCREMKKEIKKDYKE